MHSGTIADACLYQQTTARSLPGHHTKTLASFDLITARLIIDYLQSYGLLWNGSQTMTANELVTAHRPIPTSINKPSPAIGEEVRRVAAIWTSDTMLAFACLLPHC